MLPSLGVQDNKLGSSNYTPLLPISVIPAFITEWAAVLPLVCHLAGYQRDHQIVGHLALEGSISVSLFPRLGVLLGLSRLLEDGPEFIDQASSRGSPSWKVWDVMYGSIFPCANCGASAMVMKYAMKRRKEGVVRMPSTLEEAAAIIGTAQKPTNEASKERDQKKSSSSTSTVESPSNISTTCRPTLSPKTTLQISSQPTISTATSRSTSSTSMSSTQPSFSTQSTLVPQTTLPTQQPPSKASVSATGHRRYQTLHLLDCTRTPSLESWSTRLDSLLLSTHFFLLAFTSSISLSILLCLFGLFGTATVVVCGAVAQLVCFFCTVARPQGYLSGNEQGHETFMLAGLHQNTNTWYLFAGDRGVVDTLLNKTMITLPSSPWRAALACTLCVAHAVQLLAMTYVAGQKGWDGVSLVLLMGFNAAWNLRRSDEQIVRRWMEREGVSVELKTFDFTGRTMLCGAVQGVSGSVRPGWMDEILAPHPRREAWLGRMREMDGTRDEDHSVVIEKERWGEHDWKTIVYSSELGLAATKVIQSKRNSAITV
jgi:hypothetical protein